ncbi:MAG: hypothetical protein WB762_26865 [Candidatus Sulfotelmatobacter sp.]
MQDIKPKPASTQEIPATTDSSGGESNNHTRTQGVSDGAAGLWTRLIYWRVKRRLGQVPRSARVRALDPKLLRLTEAMSRHTAAPRDVCPKLKELVQLKVAVMVGCPF